MSITRCNSSSRAAPSAEPISVDEAKVELRIDYDDHDSFLSDLITEARLWAEDNVLNRCLIYQTVTEKFTTLDGDLELRWSPVSSITSVKYYDTNGTEQTLSTSYYELGERLGVSYCRLKYGQSWPSTRDQEDAVTIVYVAGYGDEDSDVPLPIRQAMKLYIQYRYDGGIDSQYLETARTLLGQYSARR